MHALVFLWQPTSTEPHPLEDFQFVVAADSGLDAAERWGIKCDVAVGDFDSASDDALERAEANGVDVRRVKAEKDETDAELAILCAIEHGATSLTIIGSSKGRADHALALMQCLGRMPVPVNAWLDDTFISVVHDTMQIDDYRGRLVSLIPLYHDVTGVTTEGLAYPLNDATLRVGSAYSISNEMTATQAHVSMKSGTLLILQSPIA